MSSHATESANVEKREAAESSATAAVTATASENASSERGLKGWKNRLMNWRSGGASTDSNTNSRDGGTCEAAAAASDATSGKGEEHHQQQQQVEGGKPSVTSPAANDASPTAEPDSAVAHASPTPPMNIWLRRALERQAESAIAQAIRDGKPIPEAALATIASMTLSVAAAAPAQVAVDEADKNDVSASEKAPATAPAPKKTSFAELMRQHREGLVPPSAQPPVKATKVVKRLKATESTALVVAHTAAGAEPTASSLSEVETTAREEVRRPARITPTTEAASSATPSAAGTVHQAAVRKRIKTTNSASAKRTQDTSAAASAAATPTHVTRVKGKASLEELRARRNRTTAGGSASHHSTISPVEGDTSVAPSSGTDNAESGHSQQDEYNDNALDAVSRLLLRYCLGDRTTGTVPSTAAAVQGVDVSSPLTGPAAAPPAELSPSFTQTTTELTFLSELMELCDNDSLTPASLELLRELFQHVRVLPRPVRVSSASKSSENADAGASDVQDGEATMEEVDAEAYREAARRREYVQQVIMVLLNRLQHMKTQEQRQKQKCCDDTTAETSTSEVAPPPQPSTGYGAPCIKVGGISLAPLPMPPPTQQQQQSVSMYPERQRMASVAPWPSMAEMASAYPDEAAAAAFTSDMMAYGYPNPYAHLTVFSQHQPVAPPVGWPSPFHSPTAGARRGHHDSKTSNSNNNVAARLVASPFPGAFPIIPPPATMDTSSDAEDREMQELFRMIRAQLTQPVSAKSSSVTTITSRVESSANLASVAPVEVSQEERAVLRHVQMDFKKHREAHQHQHQQQQAEEKGSPVPRPLPQTASTPPAASLTTPLGANAIQLPCTHATPGTAAGTETVAEEAVHVEGSMNQRNRITANKPNCPEEAGESAGESPSARNSTAPAQEESIVTGDAAAAKPRGTILSLNAKPFVPAGARGGNSSAASAIIKPTSTSGSTPTKTTFNYHARPFMPSGIASSHMSISSQKPAHMNAAAPPFIPKQQQQQQATASPPVTSPPTTGPLFNTPTTSAQAMPPPLPKSAADPWASYEMFARWRDMMEAYYQNVFAMQNAASTTTGTSSSSAMITPSHPA